MAHARLKACRRPGAHNENACAGNKIKGGTPCHARSRAALPLLSPWCLSCCNLLGERTPKNYPARPITIIVSLAPGTGMDTARAPLRRETRRRRLGQPVVIENRPAAPASSPWRPSRRAPPDGYTLAVATSAVMAIRPTLFKQRPFDPLTDFVPISHYVKSPFVFIVDPSLPVRSVPEFIKYAKDRPGQISYSSSGIGGAPHLTAELLKQKFGFDMAHVPYRNSPQSIADVAAGHVAASVAEAGAHCR